MSYFYHYCLGHYWQGIRGVWDAADMASAMFYVDTADFKEVVLITSAVS
jgi:hypothetical protein